MTHHEYERAFGALFIDALMRELHTLPVNYASLQRVRTMTQPGVVQFLRQHSGATYAQVQQLKCEHDPCELARFLARSQREQGAPAAWLWLFLAGV